MGPEKSRRASSPPIPSYDEATSASNPLLGGHNGSSTSNTRNGYQPPVAQSVRSSEDSLYASRAPFDGPHVLTSDDDDTNSDTSEGLRRDLDDLDYHADDVELEELENGTLRRRRRQDGSWKGALFGLRKRVGKWRNLWSFKIPHWSSFSSLPSFSWPTIPNGLKNSGAIIARLFGLFTLIAAGYALFAFAIFPAAQNELAAMFDPEGVRQLAQSSVDPVRIKNYLNHISSFDHIAGTRGSFFLGEWIKDLMVVGGLDEVKMDEYDVYLNYANNDGRKVAIVEPEELKWEATLDEESPYPKRAKKANTPVFHGHSKSRTVTGPLIYFNYGSVENYKAVCEDSGINCKGVIALVRQGGPLKDQGLKIKAAEKWGISGVLIYSDPADDGAQKDAIWPDGPGRPKDSVERGSASLTDWVVGDPLTPGWASNKESKRVPTTDNKGLVNIPSLPLAWRDAQKLLQSLKGYGFQLSDDRWHGGVPDVEWWSGNATSPKVMLKNEQTEEEKQRIFNVLGRINGLEGGSKAVIVGNHRDSWCFGAADPGSGTAVMLEVMSIFGKLTAQGWRPLRSIIFASWDAAEYNLIGSTEWVEDHLDDLRASGAAYINLDAAVSGPDLEASASPLYTKALQRVLTRVSDPIQNKTYAQIWEEKGSRITPLSSKKDYIPFQDLAGTSSIDLGFHGSQVPSHSCYETFEWMERFGDPGFNRHKAMAEIMVLLILEISSELILPFDMDAYALSLVGDLESLTQHAETKGAPMPDDQGKGGFDPTPLYDAVRTLKSSAAHLDKWENAWFSAVYGGGGAETNALAYDRQAHNAKLSDFETNLLDIERPGNEDGPFGIPGREQYKHVVLGPHLWSNQGEAYFPFIRDAIDEKDWPLAQKQIEKTARIISAAAEKLKAAP